LCGLIAGAAGCSPLETPSTRSSFPMLELLAATIALAAFIYLERHPDDSSD
jgi:hypothetical protein